VVIGGNGVVGAWALAAHKVESLRRRSLWWCTGAAELAIVVQIGLGVSLLKVDHLPSYRFHELYGYAAFASIGILYGYRNQLRDRIYLLYGFGGLFMMGLGLRAVQVGTRNI
jgi:hypothetical protein